MADKRYTVRANIPILGNDAHQELEIHAGRWMVALGRAARTLRKLPVMHRRRVTALSIVIEQREGSGQAILDTTGEPAVQLPLDETVNTESLTMDQQEEIINEAVAEVTDPNS